MYDLYLGHPTSYWLELKLKADKLNYVELVEEIADLRAKLGMYERHYERLDKERGVLYGAE